MENGFEEKSSQSKSNSESEKKRRLWPVEVGKNGIIGLPEGVSEKDVILFLGSDNKWWAENPSPEILEEMRLWRSDWIDAN